MAKYIRTRICGCGECRFKPLDSGPCPQEKSKDARWLWMTDYSSSREEDTVEDGEVTLDTPEAGEQTLEEVTV